MAKPPEVITCDNDQDAVNTAEQIGRAVETREGVGNGKRFEGAHRLRSDRMATDLEKAHELIRMHETFVGPIGTLRDNIDKAVADGIALGRKEGFELAIKAIHGLIGKPTL